jgi:hypothetical protein
MHRLAGSVARQCIMERLQVGDRDLYAAVKHLDRNPLGADQFKHLCLADTKEGGGFGRLRVNGPMAASMANPSYLRRGPVLLMLCGLPPIICVRLVRTMNAQLAGYRTFGLCRTRSRCACSNPLPLWLL